MQKYIAIVNPRMDNDEISRLIAQDIAGALFQINHQNYALAAKLVQQVKDLSRKQNKPVSVIQDVSEMLDPLDLEFGIRNGIDWVVVGDPAHIRLARRFNKSIPIIWKGQKLPHNLGLDSIMTKSISDPDAQIQDSPWQIQHQVRPHVKEKILAAIRDMADHSHSSAIAVSDLEEAKTLSAMRPKQKIIYAPKDKTWAPRASIFRGVHPVFAHGDLRSRQLVRQGERYVDATDGKHVTIRLIT